MPRRRRPNPWVATGEVLLWVFFALLLIPAGFAGWAVGHYTSLGGGKSASSATVTVTGPGKTVTVTTSAATTSAATTTSAGATTQKAGTTTTAAASGNPAKGKTIFASSGCASCHTFKASGATGTIGPDLDTAPKQDAQKAGMPLPAFIKQSIVDPNAYVPSGYPKGVMPTTFGSQLSSSQLNDLVAYLVQRASG